MISPKATIIIGTATIIVALSLGCVFLDVYYVVDGAAGMLYVRGDESYLFLGTSSSGYHFRYINYPVVAFREYFNAPMAPNDDRVSTTVIHITPSGLERFHLDYGNEAANAPSFITPFEDGFYAMCRGLSLCKWSGNHFEAATDEEARQHDGINRLFRGDMNGKVVNGWAVRELGQSGAEGFEVDVGNQYAIRAVNRSPSVKNYPWITVDLLRQGKSPERLYDVNGNPRIVWRGEYKKVFGRS